MTFEAQEATQLNLLMAGSGILAAAGRYLLLRFRPAGSTVKTDLFGSKFHSASVGSPVFVISAARLLLSLFVGNKGPTLAGVQPHAKGGGQAAQSSKTGPADRASPVPAETQTAGFDKVDLSTPVLKIEPDELISTTQLLLPWQRLTGNIGHNRNTWVANPVPAGSASAGIEIRHTGGSGIVDSGALDACEQVGNRIETGRRTDDLTPEKRPGSSFFPSAHERNGVPARQETRISLTRGG